MTSKKLGGLLMKLVYTCITSAIAPFLFILVGVFCEFALVPGVYILLSPQEEEVHYTIFLEGTDVQIQQHIYQR